MNKELRQLIVRKIRTQLKERMDKVRIVNLGPIMEQAKLREIIRNKINRFSYGYLKSKFKNRFHTELDDDLELSTLQKSILNSDVRTEIRDAHSKNIFKPFFKNFDLALKTLYTKETLVAIIVEDLSKKMTSKIERPAGKNFDLKTSTEYHQYSIPPMGTKEYIKQVIEEDIFDTEVLRGKK